jgi:hypothetical protein
MRKAGLMSVTNGTQNLPLQSANYADYFRVTFKQSCIKATPAGESVALLVTSEYEGIFRTGGIGTYYGGLLYKVLNTS